MINYLANPQRFLKFERYATPIFGAISLVGLGVGLWLALFNSPADYQQGETVRIMYVHVPAAWCALMAYTCLAAASFVSFVWRHNLADSAARAFAIPGAAFTFLALVTGSLWGKPIWNTWWQWDGRMTSVLVLLFIYLAYIAVWQVVDDYKKASRLAAILALVGFINIPIIKFSVEWWNSLHQPATISNIGAPGLPSEMLWPLFTMMIAYTALFGWISLTLVRNDILKQRKNRQDQKPHANIRVETL